MRIKTLCYILQLNHFQATVTVYQLQFPDHVAKLHTGICSLKKRRGDVFLTNYRLADCNFITRQLFQNNNY